MLYCCQEKIKNLELIRNDIKMYLYEFNFKLGSLLVVVALYNHSSFNLELNCLNIS